MLRAHSHLSKQRPELEPISPPLFPYEFPSPRSSPIDLNPATLDKPVPADSGPETVDDLEAARHVVEATANEMPAMTESQVLKIIQSSSPIDTSPEGESIGSLSIEEPILPQDDGAADPDGWVMDEVLDIGSIAKGVDAEVENAFNSLNEAMNETI